MSTPRDEPVVHDLPPHQDGVPLAEIHLAKAEPRFRAEVHTWLRDPLDGCTPGAIREAGTALGELVANAFGHAAPPYRVRLTLRGHVIRLAVTDATPGDAADWSLGRGLIIVRGLCARWGVVPGESGKTVWAELRVMVLPWSVVRR